MGPLLECVVNVSDGRDPVVLAALEEAAGRCLLDVHSDGDHNRTVLTLGDDGGHVEAAARAVAAEAVARLDLGRHTGAHPRMGVVDVVPFVPLAGSSMDHAVAARDRFLAWAGDVLGLPGFAYGPERSLPEVRRTAFMSLAPSAGPAVAHPTAGAVCVGARGVLVAYNVWLADGVGLAEARRVAGAVRRPGLVRALGLDVGGRAQVSMNLLDPVAGVGPADAFDAVRDQVAVDRAELVGLLPAAALAAVPSDRWAELDVDPTRTIEARLGGRAAWGSTG